MIRLHADTFIWFFRNKVCVVSLQLWVVGGREQTDWGEGMNRCIKKKQNKKEARKIWERERTYRRPICAHAWTTPDISWSALLHGIHDNTVSWEVGMTTTGREKRQQRAEGGVRWERVEEEESGIDWGKKKKGEKERWWKTARWVTDAEKMFHHFFNSICFVQHKHSVMVSLFAAQALIAV